MSKVPVSSISLFSAKSGQYSKRKVPCFTNKVLECYKHMFKIHNSPPFVDKAVLIVQIITYTVLQNCLSLFHYSQFTIINFFLPINLISWAFRFFVEGHHLTKIWLGANVSLLDSKVLSLIYPAMNSSFFSSVMAVFDKGQPLVYTFIPSFIPNMILLKSFHICVHFRITPCPTY